MCQYILKKISLGKKIIDFEFKPRGPGPPSRTCTSTTGYFHDKTKISKKFLRVDYYLPLKYCSRQCALLSFAWAKSLTKFILPNKYLIVTSDAFLLQNNAF